MSDGLLIGERHSPFRARLVAGVLAFGFMAVAIKGGMVAMGGREASPQGFASAVTIQEKRADILDRNGERLATSVTVYSLWADPGAIWDPVYTTEQLKSVLPDLNADTIIRRLSDKDRKFAWIKRELTPVQRQAIFELGLEGLHFQDEARRFYPKQSLAAHIVGYTDVDGNGIAGIEHALDERLQRSDEPVHLTIDSSIQYSLEAELADAAIVSKAIGGAGLVLDSHTGDVLAMASWPSFDPNRRQESGDNEFLNRAVGAVYELGSVFKPLTVAAGLDHGLIKPTETFNVSRPIVIGDEVIEDDHPLPNPSRATPTLIVAQSSNIGTVQIGQRLSDDRHQAFLGVLGLMDRSPIELSSSERPILPENTRGWSEITKATVSFGHGISVSPLAFATAFSSFANDGAVIAPTLLMEADPLAEPREPRRVMAAPTARLVVEMMRTTVTSGTGRRADIPGYRIAGKTGTAEKVVDGVYRKDQNVTSFAAVFPANKPRYTVLIVLDDPKGQTGRTESAAFNAAPAVGRVIERIAPILDVMPYFEDIRPVGLQIRSVSDRRSL